MEENEKIIYLKEKIETKREQFHNIIIKDNIDRENILRFSQELDILINEYNNYINKKI